jgi:hypothetical protein
MVGTPSAVVTTPPPARGASTEPPDPWTQAATLEAVRRTLALNAAQATSTRTAEQALAQPAQAERRDPRQLATDPRGHIGVNLMLEGQAQRVWQHTDYTWVELLAESPSSRLAERIVVELRPPAPALQPGGCFCFTGIAAGTQLVTYPGTRAMSAVPLVHGYGWEPATARPAGGSCAAP